MTVTPTERDAQDLTSARPTTEPIPELDKQFDWRNCWYPVTFLQDFPKDRPYPFSLYDEPLVLFRDSKRQLVCLKDLCPHRAAKLSDGQVIDGKIECLYHGWQFGAEGECLHIPQLPEDAKIPLKACVTSFKVVEKQGIVWLWAGQAETADEERIPTVADCEHPGLFCVDTVRELPVDATYLIENALDPAHVPISHDRTELNTKRENAQALEMEILESSEQGIQGRYRYTRTSNGNWTEVKFVAPNLVVYTFGNKQLGFMGGLAVYVVPLSWGKCRLILRRYGNFFSRSFRFKPRWLEHMRQNKLLEEDLAFIVELQAYMERTDKSLKEVFLPLKTSDVFVLEYRKWLDKYGQDLPFYEGYVTAKRLNNSETEAIASDRIEQHLALCSSCNKAYRTAIRAKPTLVGVAIALAALAILAEDTSILQTGAVVASLFSVGLAVFARQVQSKLEQAHPRRHQLTKWR